MDSPSGVLTGDPSQGDLFYARSKDGESFSDPIRVNSVPGSAVAIGNIRGARIAIGRRGNVYVVWNGSTKFGNPALGRSPMLFSRLNKTRTAFEPEQNLIHAAYGIDGGGGIAADQQGRVYAFWHAPIPDKQREEFRRVWIARSEPSSGPLCVILSHQFIRDLRPVGGAGARQRRHDNSVFELQIPKGIAG